MTSHRSSVLGLALLFVLGCARATPQTPVAPPRPVETRPSVSVAPPSSGGEKQQPPSPAAVASAKVHGLTPDYLPQEGDIVFQSLPINPLVLAIEGATESPFSHCGLVCQADGQWKVLEAIGPVIETPIHDWINQSRDGRVWVYRFRAEYRDKIPAVIAAGREFSGKPYDIHYDLDDEKIYCSELIFKAFQKVTGEELGRLQKLGDLKWEAHTAVIKSIENGTVPIDRMMITPRSLSEAKQLERVGEYGPEPEEKTEEKTEDPSP